MNARLRRAPPPPPRRRPTPPPPPPPARPPQIQSQADLDALLAAQAGGLTVLMCKSKSCHPCKLFKPKFGKLAAAFSDAAFCEITGDRNPGTVAMMRAMAIKATPTFVIFRGGEKLHSHSGKQAAKLIDALLAQAAPGEAGADAGQEALLALVE